MSRYARVAVASGCVLALLLLTGCGSSSAARRNVAGVDQLMLEEMERQNVPGMVVLVQRGERIEHAQAYGIAESRTRRPMSTATVFQLGSIGKQFTAAAILKLQEQGRLQLSDSLRRHVPEAPESWSGITLEHLVRQTSGIREYFTIEEWQRLSSELDRPAAELISIILRQPLTFETGSRWAYSNSNYILLAEIIERVSGIPYDEYIDQQLLRPNGLSATHCPTFPSSEREAHGYQLKQGTLVAAPPENMNWIRGDGGLCASALDLSRWSVLLQSGRLLSAQSMRLMNSHAKINDGSVAAYGMGVALIPMDGRRKIAHGGRMPGFTAVLATYPADELTITILTNRGGVEVDTIEARLARHVLGAPAPPPAVPIDEEEMQRYAGTFDIGVFPIKVEKRQDGGLWLTVPPPGPTVRLLKREDGVLVSAAEPDAHQLHFESADRVIFLMAGMHWYGRRIGR
jgi:D-alanyl-D-alanine carboxypeptidase